MLSAANLTGRRRRVARLRLWGYTSPQVAGLLGLELAVIYLEWRGAKRALRLALAAGDSGGKQALMRRCLHTQKLKGIGSLASYNTAIRAHRLSSNIVPRNGFVSKHT